MLSLFKTKPKPVVQVEPVESVESLKAEPSESVRRAKQQNIKASEDCCEAFAKIAQSAGHEQGRVVRGHGRRAP